MDCVKKQTFHLNHNGGSIYFRLKIIYVLLICNISHAEVDRIICCFVLRFVEILKNYVSQNLRNYDLWYIRTRMAIHSVSDPSYPNSIRRKKFEPTPTKKKIHIRLFLKSPTSSRRRAEIGYHKKIYHPNTTLTLRQLISFFIYINVLCIYNLTLTQRQLYYPLKRLLLKIIVTFWWFVLYKISIWLLKIKVMLRLFIV